MSIIHYIMYNVLGVPVCLTISSRGVRKKNLISLQNLGFIYEKLRLPNIFFILFWVTHNHQLYCQTPYAMQLVNHAGER